MNKRELEKLGNSSQYDSRWRKWRQGAAPKFRLNFWQRLQLSLNRRILTAFARRNPNDAVIQSALGALSQLEALDRGKNGDPEAAAKLRQDAIDKARQAVALAPDDPHEHLMLGHALDADKQHDAALAAYNEVLRLDPANPHGHSMLALWHRRQGRLREAIEEQRRSVALMPNAAGHLYLGTLLNSASQVEEAKAEWSKVLDLDKGFLAAAARLYLQGKF